MATKFIEPGGDADFGVGFWSLVGSPVTATDFVHGGHIKSIKYAINANTQTSKNDTYSDTGRFSIYLYINALPSATASFMAMLTTANGSIVWRLRITSAGILQLFENSVQIGTDGSTLSTGTWYRISIAYLITSTTVNRFEVFVNGISSISVTNSTLTSTGGTNFTMGNTSANLTFDIRISDFYSDDSSSLTDTGDIWVTAKRPNANGTTNGFSTQIGAGGSGYGSGHSPQVNERPLSNTNGWAMVGAGSAITEEYNIESRSTGDINISSAIIVDWMGWVDTKSLVGETISIILDGSTNSQAITSSETIYTKIKGSTTYPSNTGADIGIITDTSLTTVSLYECGIIVAYLNKPSPLSVVTRRNF